MAWAGLPRLVLGVFRLGSHWVCVAKGIDVATGAGLDIGSRNLGRLERESYLLCKRWEFSARLRMWKQWDSNGNRLVCWMKKNLR